MDSGSRRDKVERNHEHKMKAESVKWQEHISGGPTLKKGKLHKKTS